MKEDDKSGLKKLKSDVYWGAWVSLYGGKEQWGDEKVGSDGEKPGWWRQ